MIATDSTMTTSYCLSAIYLIATKITFEFPLLRGFPFCILLLVQFFIRVVYAVLWSFP